MNRRRVVITGLGAVTPIGLTAGESWQAVQDGVCGVAPITQFDPTGMKVQLAAEVKDFVPEKAGNVLDWLGGSVTPISNWHEMYNLELYRLASSCSVPVIDITSCFLSKRNYSDYLCEDGMHPNEEGHRLISDVILSANI